MIKYEAMVPLDFVGFWLEKAEEAKKQKTGYIFEFFCYYVAFNSLYAKYQLANVPEDQAICEYVSELISQYDGIDLTLFSALNSEEKEEFDKDVMRLQRDNEKRVRPSGYRHLIKDLRKKKNEESELQRLFVNIYQIRCNLFHGSKEFSGDEYYRSYALVNGANKVLNKLLNIVVNKKILVPPSAYVVSKIGDLVQGIKNED